MNLNVCSSRKIFKLIGLMVLLCGVSADRLFAQISIASGGFTTATVCPSTAVISGCVVATNNNATPTESGSLQLTASTSNQVGSAWSVSPQTVVNGFSSSFTFQFTGSSNPPADGIAFVIQNVATNPLQAIGFTGGNGGAIGYGDDDGNNNPNSGIPHSLAIEFDTYQNSWDINANHVAVQTCGTGYNTSHHQQLCANEVNSTVGNVTPLSISLTDGNIHTVTIQYNPPGTPCNTAVPSDASNLCIYLDQTTTPVLAVTTDLGNIGLGTGGTAFVGFTGATGGDFETQNILSWSFSQTIVGTPLQPGTTQTFNFSTTPGAVDVFAAITPQSNTLKNSGAIPTVTSFSVPPATAVASWAGTPLATATCWGLVSANGNCAPKLEVCTISGNMTPSGTNCPYDLNAQDVLLADTFDPAGTFPTSFPPGQDPGVVSFNDSQGCPFAGIFATLPCPSNGSKSFIGPGAAKTTHGGSNSYYFYVTGVLPPKTTLGGFVNVNGTNWVNGKNVQFTLTSAPPATPSPNPTGFYPSPIDYIAYLNEPASNPAPDPTLPLPMGSVTEYSNNSPLPPGNTTVFSNGSASSTTCPTVVNQSGKIMPADPSYSFPLTATIGSLAEGNYQLYYETEDCTRTAERQYTYLMAPGSWVTNYKSLAYSVDDTAPTISISVPKSGATYTANSTVPSNFQCADSGSGIGPSGCNGPAQVNTTPTNGILTPQTFTVTATDNVGNTTSQTVNYSISCLYAENTISPSTLVRGKTFTITPALTNCTNSWQALTVSVVLSGPMGQSCATKSQTLVNKLTLPIPPSRSFSFTFGPFTVPKTACAGSYTFTTTSSNKGTTDFTYTQTFNVQ
jgi:hypothetical protein